MLHTVPKVTSVNNHQKEEQNTSLPVVSNLAQSINPPERNRNQVIIIEKSFLMSPQSSRQGFRIYWR